MKAEVKEEEIVKHWGIWVKNDQHNNWLVGGDGSVMHFTCPRVANVQHDLLVEQDIFKEKDLSVLEIK